MHPLSFPELFVSSGAESQHSTPEMGPCVWSSGDLHLITENVSFFYKL